MNSPRQAVLPALLAVVLAMAPLAQAAPPPQAQREIAQLITALGRSGCDFERNGRWYPAVQAQKHLQQKYDWLRKRDLVASAEQFIDRAGSQSSLSGRAYRVRCPGDAPMASADWLQERLRLLRRPPSR